MNKYFFIYVQQTAVKCPGTVHREQEEACKLRTFVLRLLSCFPVFKLSYVSHAVGYLIYITGVSYHVTHQTNKRDEVHFPKIQTKVCRDVPTWLKDLTTQWEQLAVVKWNMLHFYGKSVMFAFTPNAITMSLIAHSLHFHVWEGETVWSFGSKMQEPRTPLGWVTHHNNIIYMFPSLYQARREAVELCTVWERLQGAICFILYINRYFEILGRNVPSWICNFSPCWPLY